MIHFFFFFFFFLERVTRRECISIMSKDDEKFPSDSGFGSSSVSSERDSVATRGDRVLEAHLWRLWDKPIQIVLFRPLDTYNRFKEEFLDSLRQFWPKLCAKIEEYCSDDKLASIKQRLSDKQMAVSLSTEDLVLFSVLEELRRNVNKETNFNLVENYIAFCKCRASCGLLAIEALCILLYTHEFTEVSVYVLINSALSTREDRIIKLLRTFIGTISVAIRKLSTLSPSPEDFSSGEEKQSLADGEKVVENSRFICYCKHFRRKGVEPFTGSKMVVPKVYSTTLSVNCPNSLLTQPKPCVPDDPDIIIPYMRRAAVLPSFLCSKMGEEEVLFEAGSSFRRKGKELKGARVFFELEPSEQVSLLLPHGINYCSGSVIREAMQIACLHFLHSNSWDTVLEVAKELFESKNNEEWKKFDDEKISGEGLEWLNDENVVSKVIPFKKEEFKDLADKNRFIIAVRQWREHYRVAFNENRDLFPSQEIPNPGPV